ncbi:MAG: type II/IV secretion system ATPase subunit [Candidatus Woesearchaeota archaeon]|nr:type II/IV secretion system ATPase subunit [Candidatus Woesearchaeota archaeon]
MERAKVNRFLFRRKSSEEKTHKKTEASPILAKSAVSAKDEPERRIIDKYSFLSDGMPIDILICRKKGEFVPIYEVSISTISANTQMILEKIRLELVDKVDLGINEMTDVKRTDIVEKRFSESIRFLISKYFTDASDKDKEFMTAYLIQRSLGMGSIEILMDDNQLEEVVINGSDEPAWVYHKKYNWLKTNVRVENEDQVKQYAAQIGRKVGRQISILNPLLDAHLSTGDRANCTLIPISSRGNTITLRKFASDPWTITSLLQNKTIPVNAAAIIWLAIQYELSMLITGGTASGKTSTLNVIAAFIPPNQRVISIEDTRELQLPKFLHWVPLLTRLPNPEGKGEISMLDLLVNSLRMRPDRILVGEIRRQNEAEVLFEAIHTGHSVYATVHANSVSETITRLTSPPINTPKSMLPAISLLLVQYRNRRTGMRRSFQLAEILPDASANVLMQYDVRKDVMNTMNKSISLIDSLQLFTGMSVSEIESDLKEKELILNWLVNQNLKSIDEVGLVMAEYYTDKDNLMKFVKANRKFE